MTLTDYPIRSKGQNNSLHKWCRQIAETMQEAGIDREVFMKIPIKVPISETLIKEYFKAIALNSYGKDSTTKLTTKECQEVAESLTRHLGEAAGIHVPWPSIETLLFSEITE